MCLGMQIQVFKYESYIDIPSSYHDVQKSDRWMGKNVAKYGNSMFWYLPTYLPTYLLLTSKNWNWTWIKHVESNLKFQKMAQLIPNLVLFHNLQWSHRYVVDLSEWFLDGSSVTRFGEILPLWQNFKILWHFKALFSIVQNIELTVVIFCAFGKIFIVLMAKYWKII